MTTLILIRHGETTDNANRIMQGQTQGALNENGRKQALNLSYELKDTHIDVFLSSDLKRAEDTCKIIAEPHNATIITTPLLRERDWGSFTGRFIPDLNNEPWPDDIETVNHLKKRASDFIDYVRNSFPSQTVLAVGHGIINKAVQSVFYNKEMKDIKPMTNAEVRTLVVDD